MALARFWDSVVNPGKEEKNKAANRIGESIVGLFDSLNMGLIFGLFLTPVGMAMMPALSPILFPLAIAFAVLKAGLAWREYFLEPNRRNLVTAAKETLFSTLVVTAVIGSLAIPGFGIVTPILFSTFCGLNLLYNGGSTAYYAGKAAQVVEMDDLSSTGKKKTKKPLNSIQQAQKAKNVGLAKGHMIGLILGAAIAVAVVCLFLLPPLGVVLSATAVTTIAAVGVTAIVAAIGLTLMGIRGEAKKLDAKPPVKAKKTEETPATEVIKNNKKNRTGNRFIPSQKGQRDDDDKNPLLPDNSQDSKKIGKPLFSRSVDGFFNGSFLKQRNEIENTQKTSKLTFGFSSSGE